MIGSLPGLSPQQLDFLKLVSNTIGVGIHTTQEAENILELLKRTQAQSEELEVQQEELRESNDRLLAQEEELRVSNEDLYEKSVNLEH